MLQIWLESLPNAVLLIPASQTELQSVYDMQKESYHTEEKGTNVLIHMPTPCIEPELLSAALVIMRIKMLT